MSNSKKLTDYNFTHGLHRGQNGFYRPILPEDVNRPLTHDEMDYNIQLIGGIIAGYRVIGTGTDGALDVTNDANKRLKLYKVTSSDTEIIASGSEINNLVWIVDNEVLSPGEVTGDLVPDQNEVYDLGSPTKKFRDLYLSNNTIYLGTNSMSMVNGVLHVNGSPLDVGSDLLANVNDIASQLGIETELRTTAISNINEELTSLSNETGTLAQSILDLDTKFTADLTDAITGETLARTTAISNINEELTSLTNADLALAQSITDLSATFTAEIDSKITGESNSTTTAISNINEELTSLTNADLALAQSITDLSAEFQTDLTDTITGETLARTTAISNINEELTSLSNANQAIAQSITDLSATFTTEIDSKITGESDIRTAAISNINEELTSLSNANQAIAQSITDLSAEFQTDLTDAITGETLARTTAISNITQELTTLSNASQAIAESVSNLGTSFSTELNNKISAEETARNAAIQAEILARNAAIQAVADLVPTETNLEGLAKTTDLQAEALERARLLGIETTTRTEAISNINEELTSLTNADLALAQSVNTLGSTFSTDLTNLENGQNLLRTNAIASVQESITALTNANSAIVNSINSLGTQFDIDIDAAIASEAALRATAITNVTNQIAALSDANSAAVTRVDTLEAQYTITDGSITGFSEASALKTTIDSAIATANQATIDSTTSAIAALDDQVAGVTQGISASVDALTNKVNAQYTLEVNADGNVAGMKLGADETGSSIAFTADSFKVSSEDGNGTLLTPFSIINGQVAFNGAVSFSEGPQGPAGPAGEDGANGLDGLDGADGLPGADGTSTYFHIAYADTASGGGFSQSPIGKLYIGTYVDSTSADAPSGSPLWKWQLVKGADGENGENGIAGTNGTDGKTTYLHIAYATDITGTTGFSTTVSTGKTYIGQYTDFTLADSTNPALYKWALIKGDKGDQGVPGAPGADGSAGANARAVNLTCADQVFTYNTSGTTPLPINTVITATAFNTSGTVYYRFYLNNEPVSAGQLPTYTYTPQANFIGMPDTIEVEMREGNNNLSTPVLARDQITMSGIKPGTDGANGADGMTVILSNEAHTLPTTSAGVVEYLGSGTSIRVYEGVSEILYDGVGAGYSTWKVTASPTDIETGVIRQVLNFAMVGDHQSMTQNTASITYTITGKRFNGASFSFTKTQTFAKSIQGATGPQGPAPDVSQFLTTTTVIDGGNITSGIIKNGDFAIPVSATNATNATNLQTAVWNTYASTGMGINLDKGAINSKNFYIDPDGNAKFKGDMDIDGGVKVGGSLMADFFEVANVNDSLGLPIGPRLRMKSNAYIGDISFVDFSDDVSSKLVPVISEELGTTLSHRYIKRNDTQIEPGDLVKLDENGELIKATSSKDTAIVGILWAEVDYSIKPHPMDKYRTTEKVFVEEDHHYRDSLGNKLQVADRETKTLWKVASIGDSREGTLTGMKVCDQNGPVLKGDLTCSSDTPGYVMKQPTEWAIIGFDNGIPQYEERQIITSYTVGKCMEDCTFDNEGKTEGIYGYLYCG